jgi:hypothetical protein
MSLNSGDYSIHEIKKSAPDIEIVILSGLVHDDVSLDEIISRDAS